MTAFTESGNQGGFLKEFQRAVSGHLRKLITPVFQYIQGISR
jgi:hypothetical protein